MISCPQMIQSNIGSPSILYHPHHPDKGGRGRIRIRRSSIRCAVSLEATTINNTNGTKPAPAEISRTIMDLSSVATLSIFTATTTTTTPQEEDQGLLLYPLSFGVRFAVDPEGTPLLCLNPSSTNNYFPFLPQLSTKSTLHVQLNQCGLRTPQCTIQGTLNKPPQHTPTFNNLQSIWTNKFHQQLDQHHMYILSVQRVLHIQDFMEDGVWFTSEDYRLAVPDPLRHSAENIVNEINTHNVEDLHRFCNVYVDLDIQVSKAKMVWVDRLGFDMRLTSPQNDVFEVRIPFPREVADEKGAKSSFNCMSQLAWEMEKNYHAHDFNKVKQFKKVTR